jgi:branched-subunit amino acid transport protein
MTDIEMVVTIVGLGLVSLLTRGFFLFSDRALPMPPWLTQGLRYAPLGALVAIVLPDIVMSQGELVSTWRDPRLLAAVAAAAWYFWRRGIVGTLLVGMGVLMALRFGLGWVSGGG